jgi:organic radical activating enzyme
VSEIFGPTLQGEGPSAGQLAAFVRLGMCNLDCRWCDTAYTWDRRRYDLDAGLRWLSVGNVWREVAAMRVGLLVITGGEPLLQQAALPLLLDAAGQAGWRVEIETNGTIRPLPTIIRPFVRFNVSVKLAGSGVAEGRRIHPPAIRAFATTGRVTWKFVVDQPGDVAEIAQLQDRFGLDPVWVMPQGTTAAQMLDRLPRLAEDALAHSWHLTPRLHILLWGDVRGR